MEPVVLRVGGTLVGSAMRLWLTRRQGRAERTAPLVDLIGARLTDDFQRRRFHREVEALVDVVAERLLPLCRQEAPGLTEQDRLAAMAEVASAFDTADLSDAGLFEVDVDPAKLARRLRAELPAGAGLGEAASWFYTVLLDECCACFVQLVVHLTPFAARASAELLGRVSGLSEQVGHVLARLPAPTVLAPHGTANDAGFRTRYLRLVSESLDDIELFGVDVRRFRPRTTLSVAYISLSVSGAQRRGDVADEVTWWREGSRDRQDGAVRVERALAANDRILIRGEAGSGKSTLLRWLAITAARGAFRGDLADLNGRVPFLIKLRGHAGRGLPGPEGFVADAAQPLAAMMPPGFAHRQLESGRALVLVDGVDELPAAERAAVRVWLGRLTRAFPDARWVLTSRPGAAAAEWLRAEGFGSAFLERMNAADVRALIRHWHRAARDAGGLPCDEADLPRHEGALLSRLEANPHLRALATTPLLCAMLCALNLDRRTFLPRDRLELYRTALTLLLDRRDAERHIPGAAELTSQDRRHLLRHLAWRLSVNGRSELGREEAVRRLADRLTAMPRVAHDAETVLDHLVHRSGVVREPATGRIDFVHRSFQEFLTAEEAADQGDIGLLVDHAHLDQWRDVVVMAAGLAIAPLRVELLTGLLDRADAEPRHRRRLHLLAAAAMESDPALTPGLADRLERCLAELLPPRRTLEARSLAAGGEVLLPRLLADPRDLSEAAAAATVRTAALINGPDAWPVLERFARDPRHEVQRELVKAWHYFDPAEYADRVLSDAPLIDGQATVHDQDLLPHVGTLRHLTDLTANLENLIDLDLLADLPHLTSASLGGRFDDVTPLSGHRRLRSLLLSSSLPVRLSQLVDLDLESLYFYPRGHPAELADLPRLRRLSSLGVRQPASAADLDLLAGLRSLTRLAVYDHPDGADFAALHTLDRLWELDLGHIAHPGPLGIDGGLRHIARALPWLEEVGFVNVTDVGDLGELAAFPNLRRTSLRHCAVDDLSPLAAIPTLDTLRLSVPVPAGHLDQVKALTRLSVLDLLPSERAERIDLSPLGDRRLIVRVYGDDHRVSGVGPGITVERASRRAARRRPPRRSP
ncbi:NACHT domain-containing protein [Saccharothrix saharensis]|uniref:NACHT domain-containing protein n=1 Tax=Saccharothrix saharensis TaxID=571190 RepID=A0A543J8S7_9PSEU|nr:NACHT domain-containing protein [Saccharothrix saharensis]TQM79219.1 NACHT domain-containing protein [Saccharothrix saharensis]